jgi:hypothetical protein
MVAAVTTEDYETRIAQLLNSIFLLAANPNLVGGQGLQYNNSVQTQELYLYQNVTGTTTVGYDVICCDRAWLGVLFSASTIIF